MSEKDEQTTVEAPAYNGRPADRPLPNSTFAERAAARQKVQGKAVDVADDGVEDKAVESARTKRRSSKG